MSLPGALYSPPFAHRGLWRPDDSPENSLSAFEKACQTGYGIELDVRLSSDGEVMVFHDATLARMCGIEASIWDLTAQQLGATPLRGGPDTIPTLKQTLDLVAGRAMVLVEIKAGPDGGGLLEARTAALLDHYRGPAAVISFEPEALAWFAKHRPRMPRGLDAMGLSDKQVSEGAAGLAAAFDSACALARPDFLVLELETALGKIAAQRRASGLPVLAWTVRSTEDAGRVAEDCENFIFESFTA